MKRFVLFLPAVVLFAGCAQVFDGNLFLAIDTPPPLSTTALAKASVSDIQSMMSDDSFYVQLQNDPNALVAAQTALEDAYTNPAATDAEVVDAAQTYILVTAYGSDAGVVVQQAITEATSLISGGSADDAVANLVAGKSAAEISALLENFLDIGVALDAMQVSATSGAVVDSALFFGDSNDEGDLATIALVAAAVTAMLDDVSGVAGDGYSAGDLATIAAQLAAGSAPSSAATGTKALTKLSTALDGSSVNPATNPFAYLSAVTGMLPF